MYCVMSNQNLSDSTIEETDVDHDGIADVQSMNAEEGMLFSTSVNDPTSPPVREVGDHTMAGNVPIIEEEIFLPNGQEMNAKTTLQSFDSPVSRNIVAAAVQMRNRQSSAKVRHELPVVVLPSGELINAKNTVQSYNMDVDCQVVRDENEAISITDGVVAEVIRNNPNPHQHHSLVDELNVEAYAVQSYLVAKSEPWRPWFTQRFIYVLLLILILVIGSILIGVGTHCGFNRCRLMRMSSQTSANTTTPTPTTHTNPSPNLSSNSTIQTKESIITSYINSISLSNRRIHINGGTAEDLALTWIIRHDPIFNHIDDATWATLLLPSSNNASSSISATQIRLRQRYALLSLWFQQPLLMEGSIDSISVIPTWRNTSGWLQHENECDWNGINCNLIYLGGFIGGQHIVTEMDFFDNDRVESAVVGGNNITATIPAEFGLLTSMNRIDFSANNFFGTIPEVIFEKWNSVESIQIGYNQISGTIPASIGFMSTLKILNITYNHISGMIPSSIGQCASLERFDVGDNQLTGSLPESIGSVTNMKVFNVQANHLNGSIPATSTGNWTNMTDFYIYENLFSGTIPDTIGQWKALRNLNIEYNRFTGTLPHSIGQLSNVRRLDVSDNMLTGTIPQSIGNCTSLIFFSIEDNNIGGSIPESVGTLTSLTALVLYSNQLTGSIPEVVGHLTSLRLVSVENNQLSGTIPQSVGNWSGIDNVQLYNNSLTGTVPLILCTFNASNITTDFVM